jgi:hypothetical protein
MPRIRHHAGPGLPSSPRKAETPDRREPITDQEQDGTSAAGTHRLLAVGLPRRPDHDLRAAFPGGETLSIGGASPKITYGERAGDVSEREKQ